MYFWIVFATGKVFLKWCLGECDYIACVAADPFLLWESEAMCPEERQDVSWKEQGEERQ